MHHRERRVLKTRGFPCPLRPFASLHFIQRVSTLPSCHSASTPRFLPSRRSGLFATLLGPHCAPCAAWPRGWFLDSAIRILHSAFESCSKRSNSTASRALPTVRGSSFLLALPLWSGPTAQGNPTSLTRSNGFSAPRASRRCAARR